MVNINLNISSLSELEKCLELLQAKGLLSDDSQPHRAVAAKVIPTAGAKDGRGDLFRRLVAQSQERLAELGLEKAPKPTERELELQRAINEARKAAGDKQILFRHDLVSRETALAEHGYNIFDSGEPEPSGAEENGVDFGIDYNNPVV